MSNVELLFAQVDAVFLYVAGFSLNKHVVQVGLKVLGRYVINDAIAVRRR